MAGDPPVADSGLLLVHVVDEEVEGTDALLQPPLDPLPFGGLDDARDDVEGPELLNARLAAVHVEGDALVEEGPLRRLLPGLSRGGEDFVVETPRIVGVEAHRSYQSIAVPSSG